MSVEPYEDFFFGSVTREHFSDALETPKFCQVLSDIRAGIKRCADTPLLRLLWGRCSRQQILRKWLVRATQTMYGRYAVQMPLDIVLNDIEQSLEVGG